MVKGDKANLKRATVDFLHELTTNMFITLYRSIINILTETNFIKNSVTPSAFFALLVVSNLPKHQRALVRKLSSPGKNNVNDTSEELASS